MEIAYLLPFQKTQGQYPEPTVQDSQLPVTPVPGDPKPSSGLLGYLCAHACVHTHVNIHLKIMKLKFFKVETMADSLRRV